MPTVLRSGPYRIYFFSHDRDEPPHVHVDRDDKAAKFWLTPVTLASNLGFSGTEQRRIESLIEGARLHLLEAGNEFYGE